MINIWPPYLTTFVSDEALLYDLEVADKTFFADDMTLIYLFKQVNIVRLIL